MKVHFILRLYNNNCPTFYKGIRINHISKTVKWRIPANGKSLILGKNPELGLRTRVVESWDYLERHVAVQLKPEDDHDGQLSQLIAHLVDNEGWKP